MNKSRIINRRRLLAGMASAASLAAPATQQAPATDEDLKAAVDRTRECFERIRGVRLPRATEPATLFRP